MVDDFACRAFIAEEYAPVFGIMFSPLTLEALSRHVLHEPVPPGNGVRLLVTANVDHVSNLVRSAHFRSAYGSAWATTADGMPVYLYARLRGSAVPERITGADLSRTLLDRLPSGCRPFFVVSQGETADRLRACLTRRGLPADAIGSACPAFGFENSLAASAALARAIRTHRTTHIFFGLGAPKSEIWLHQHRHSLGDAYALAIGASLDFYVGLRQRAPAWMCRSGLEWAWRVVSEPKRLFRRYFVESWFAIWAVVLDLFGVKIATDDAQRLEQEKLSA